MGTKILNKARKSHTAQNSQEAKTNRAIDVLCEFGREHMVAGLLDSVEISRGKGGAYGAYARYTINGIHTEVDAVMYVTLPPRGFWGGRPGFHPSLGKKEFYLRIGVAYTACKSDMLHPPHILMIDRVPTHISAIDEKILKTINFATNTWKSESLKKFLREHRNSIGMEELELFLKEMKVGLASLQKPNNPIGGWQNLGRGIPSSRLRL